MRKLIKKILKEDDWDFVRDIKSNQDIAQEIADKTKIKDGLSHTPFRSPLSIYLPLSHTYSYSSYNPPSSFTEYCKEQYGLTKGDIEDVWKRHKDIIKDKLNNLNESDELDWIRDIEPPNFNSLVGKALYFEPYIDNMVDLERILEVLSGMGFTYGPWANGVSFEDEEEIVGLYLDPRNNNIVWTDLISEDYEEHISEWAEKPVEVLDGWLTLGDFLYSNKKKL